MTPFDQIYDFHGRMLLRDGKNVDTGHWQAMKDVPQTKTIELEDVLSQYPVGNNLADDIKPNMPWAEDHFGERVGGVPLNPPPSHEWWPFAQAGNKAHREGEKFSHTYPERFWPKYAGGRDPDYLPPRPGIRYYLGDLKDVVNLLTREPHTRQAFLPVWFPEDTGAVSNQRVPCSLGYHFLLRDGQLNVKYFIRSCDFFRHFRDDVYMACRLLQWVLHELQAIRSPEFAWWDSVEYGTLTMFISSLHVFEPERSRLEREFGGD